MSHIRLSASIAGKWNSALSVTNGGSGQWRRGASAPVEIIMGAGLSPS